MTENLMPATVEAPKEGISVRFIRQFDIVKDREEALKRDTLSLQSLQFHPQSFYFSSFGCGYATTSKEAAKRHFKSGCKGCRRYVRKMAAILARRQAGLEVY